MKRLGALPPKYNFALNPHMEARFTKCPHCNKKTGQRKLPLVIHIEPQNLIVLNYTNKYCNACDLLIAHQHEIEHHLVTFFWQSKPEIIGNTYLVLGTIERNRWKVNKPVPQSFEEMRQHIHDFISHQKIQMSAGGWYADYEEPPIMPQSLSTEWVKG